MKISIYPPLSIHEIGQRPNQEDAIAQWDNRLFVLCDGMGGHEKGEVASQTVCQSLVRWFEKNIKDESFSDDQLREALEYAYTELDKYDDGSPKKMGTTLALLYIHNKGVTAAHIGDSRIYHIRPNAGVLYRSRDHSLAFDLFQAGEITYDEIATFPQKNLVTRAMTPGEDNRMRPDIIHINNIWSGDCFLLCSDGMFENMDVDVLCRLFQTNQLPSLISCTESNQDNHSAWFIHVKEAVRENADDLSEDEESTSRCNAINIIPKVSTASDEDDVVIVSQPEVQPKKRNKWIKICASFLVTIFALVIIWTLFFRSDDKPELQRPKPMMQTPMLPRFNNDTTKKDTNQAIQYESAGNKQQFNAQGRNHSTGHIQNR